MAITQRTAVETLVTSAVANITVTKPTGLSDGDFVVICFAVNGGTISTGPSGFTQLLSVLTQANPKFYIWTKYITNAAGEGAWTFTASAVTKTAIAQAYIGVDSTTPIDVTPTTGTGSTGSATMTVAQVTTTVNGALLLYAAALNSSTATLTAPAGMTETLEVSGTKKQSLNHEDRATAGATGSRAGAASSNSLAWAAALFALRPAGASTSGPPGFRKRYSRMTQIRM